MHYNTDSIFWSGLYDKEISSVAIPQGYSLELYKNDGTV